jgi:3-keto-disaccharide hydrolase
MTWNFSLRIGLFVCVLLLCLSSGAEPGQARKLRLFDGKSFQGWEGDTDKTFRIQEGAVVAGSLSAKVPRNEFLCTRKSYKNFVLQVKFKVLGTGANAGVQFRSKRIPNHHEVIGYQADMGDPEWWGCLYDESRRRKVLAKADLAAVNKVLKRNDWNEYVIRCEGERVQLSINGLQTVDYIEPEDSIEQDGVICLQIHGGPPSEAWYKDVSIQELR